MKKLSISMRSLLLLLSLLVSHNSYSKDKIVLPPMPKSDDPDYLLGPDANKNLVRDDVEHFIYKTITKDPALFRSYLKFAANDTRFILAETADEVKKEFDLSLSMIVCAHKFIPHPREFLQHTDRIRGEVINSKVRRRRSDFNNNKLPTSYTVTAEQRKKRFENMKKEVCI